MANRTRQDWELVIDTYALANGITLSTSAVAEWKLWRDLIITIAMTLERIVNLFKKDVEVYLNNEQHGGLYWYGQISKEFQYGDNLVVVDGIVKYPTITPANLRVSHVSVKEVNDEVLVLKVAKSVSGVLAPLSAPELASFKSYIAQRKLPGTKININSNVADLVNYDIEIYYDVLFDPAIVQQNVLDSLNLFKNNLAFDAVLYKSAFVDAVMNAEGVKGLNIYTLDIDMSDGNNYELVNYLELQAGYFNWNAALLTLTPQI